MSCGNGKVNYFPMEEGLTYEYLAVVSKPYEQRMYAKITYLDWRELKGEKVIPRKIDIINKSPHGEETKYTFSFYGMDNDGIFDYAEQRDRDIEPIIKPRKLFN
jgi:hypothetical protein